MSSNGILRCPKCLSTHPRQCGERIFGEVLCEACKQFSSPCVLLPCHHALCDADFEKLHGIFKEPTSSSDNSEQRGDSSGKRLEATTSSSVHQVRIVGVEALDENEVHELSLEHGCTAAVLRVKVAELLSMRTGAHVNVSRIKLIVNGLEVVYTESMTEDHVGVLAKLDDDVIEEGWERLGESWSGELKAKVQELASTQTEGSGLWSGTGAFQLLVIAINNLCCREQRRGGLDAADEEEAEIIEVIREASSRSGATPDTVLAAIRDEFGA